MHFCSTCGNMYYLRLKKEEDSEETILIYYCRNCGNEDVQLMQEENNICVSKSNIKKVKNYNNMINKYTKLDPTLPRIQNIDCPNTQCPSNEKKTSEKGEKTSEKGKETDNETEKEILYIRYDDANMKFIYLCASCDSIWTTDKK